MDDQVWYNDVSPYETIKDVISLDTWYGMNSTFTSYKKLKK